MTRQQRIVLSSALLVIFPLSGFAECRSDLSRSQGSAIAETQPVIQVPDAPARHVTITPSRTAERGSFTPRPVMLMAGVGIALGLLIRTVKVRIN